MDTAKAAARPYDFLAVIDLQPDDSTAGSRYGHVARVVRVPARKRFTSTTTATLLASVFAIAITVISIV